MQDRMRGKQGCGADPALAAALRGANEAVVAELRGLRGDVRELISLLRETREAPVVGGESQLPAKLPAMMTIAEAAEKLRTSPRALYMRIRRGVMPGVVRIGSRRLMVKTDELLRGLRRMPTLE